MQFKIEELENGEKREYTVFPSLEENVGSNIHYDNLLM